jgi:hypothetical protein
MVNNYSKFTVVVTIVKSSQIQGLPAGLFAAEQEAI